MALHHLCHNCGWKESKHLFQTSLTIDEQRQRDITIPGYLLPLCRCPSYRPPRAEVAERIKIEDEVAKYLAV